MIRYYTAAEIRHIYQLPDVAEVYRLANENRWRRSQDRKRPVLYNADDVEATMNGNTPTSASCAKQDHGR